MIKSLRVFSGIIVFFFLVSLAESSTQAIEFAPPERIVIEALGLDEEIVSVGLQTVVVNGQQYYQWAVDDNRVGWHNLSAMLGQPGNTVLNGHSDIYQAVFSTLPQLQLGDTIEISNSTLVRRYVVSQRIIVQEKGVSLEQRIQNAQLIAPTADERLTLITCLGIDAAQRIIIIALPEELDAESEKDSDE